MAVACLCSGLLLLSVHARAEERGLAIELNKVEDLDGGCLASLVFQNSLGVALDRFNLELILFDSGGVIVQRLMIDLAPLRDGKTRVAQFRLYDGPCSNLSRVLVNDVPACRAEGDGELDCLAGLSVFSRSEIDLVK